VSLEVCVRHDFGGFALDVDFAAPSGAVALFGPSGSGKTTTVNAVAGLLTPQDGRIAANGDVLLDSAAGRDVPVHRRRIGYVFQDARLFPHMAVRDNLLFGWRRAGRPGTAADIERTVEILGIGELLDRRPAALSGGERQRVSLGRTLLARPRLLLLDEPLAGLDGPRRAEILPYLERLRDEGAVPMIYVTHTLDEAIRMADHMVILDRGRVAASGPVVDLMARLDLYPYTGRYEAGAVIDARVAGHDPADSLTRLDFPGGALVVPELDQPVGSGVRVRVRSRDVMLSKSPLAEVSALNVLSGEVAGVRREEGAFAEVQVAVGPTMLLARITRRSADALGLAPGVPIHAVIKSVAVDRRSLAQRGEGALPSSRRGEG